MRNLMLSLAGVLLVSCAPKPFTINNDRPVDYPTQVNLFSENGYPKVEVIDENGIEDISLTLRSGMNSGLPTIRRVDVNIQGDSRRKIINLPDNRNYLLTVKDGNGNRYERNLR